MGKRRESLLILLSFVEFVGSVIFVDLKLSQNPLLPTTNAQFSVRENLEICHFFCEVANFKIHSPLFPRKIFPFGAH